MSGSFERAVGDIGDVMGCERASTLPTNGSNPADAPTEAVPTQSPSALIAQWASLDIHERRAQSSRVSRELVARTGRGLDLCDLDLSGLDLSGIDLRHANLSRTGLAGTRLRGANLEQATLICPSMERADLRDANLRGAYTHAIGVQVACLVDANFSAGPDSTGSLFHGSDLRGANLAGTNFAGSLFYQCQLADTCFDGASLIGAVINECDVTRASFRGAALDQTTFTKCSANEVVLDEARGEGLVMQQMTAFTDVRMRGASLPAARIRHCNLTGVDLSNASLSELDLSHVGVSRVNFAGANLERMRALEVRGEQVCFAGATLTSARFDRCALPGADFRGASGENMSVVESSMRGSNFGRSADDRGIHFAGRCLSVRDSDLTGANFSGAYLYRSSFTGDPMQSMSLLDCDFSNANLIQSYVAATLVRSRLRGADAAYVRLNQSDMTDVDLTGACLYEASMVKTRLTRADLSGVEPPCWLDRCPDIESATMDDALRRWTVQLDELLRGYKRGST